MSVPACAPAEHSLKHYRILEKIGAGGMGEVFRARDTHLEREVAIKLLPAGTLPDENARKRLRNEALALSKLNHPNIATIFDFDTEADTDFIVTELVSGATLGEKIAAGPLPERKCLISVCNWPRGWRPRTSAAWSTATSSPPTCA